MAGNYADRLDGYVDVAQRITLFREKYPEGSLQPANPAEPYRLVEIDTRLFLVYVAAAYRHPDDTRPGIGTAWEPFPGLTPYTKNSELMVAETSAWGRAIKACLLDDRSKVASLDEVRARRTETPSEPPVRPVEPRNRPEAGTGPKNATDAQKRLLEQMAGERGYSLPTLDAITFQDASDLITHLKTLKKVRAGTKPAPAPNPDDQEEPF